MGEKDNILQILTKNCTHVHTHTYTHTHTLIENKMNLGRVSIHILYVCATVKFGIVFQE